MNKKIQLSLLSLIIGGLLTPSNSVIARNAVAVIPIGGAIGNAISADVVAGKTFSSKIAGKGIVGTFTPHPMGKSFTNSVGMTFNLLPAGTFTMGSTTGEPGRRSDETQHNVTLSQSFYIQITEVTNQQWNSIITGTGVNPSTSHTTNPYPVEHLNWYEAVYFANQLSIAEGKTTCYVLNACNGNAPGADMECDSVDITDSCTGYRLPTEAQWEYAARAGKTTAYANPVYFDPSNNETENSFNSNLYAMGWYSYNNTMESTGGSAAHETGTKPVASKQPNSWGLYDMHGNVFEWCRDWWDGTSAYSADSVTNPTGDATGTGRVVRGGAWLSTALNTRSAARANSGPDVSNSITGFRLILPSGN